MIKISACIITKNEESNIQRCIQSYADIVDEIIVVDTGSIDNTVVIAQTLGAKVIFYNWEKDFSKAKNIALNHATGDWIIFLDADEYVDPNSKQQIVSYIRKYHDSNKVARIITRLINLDSLDNKIIDESRVTRIFRKHPCMKYHGRIHETIQLNGVPPNWIYAPEIIIFHTGYSHIPSKEKQLRNLELLLLDENLGTGDSLYTPYYIAQTYFNLKEYSKTLFYIRQIINNALFVLGHKTRPFEIFFYTKIEIQDFDEEYESILHKAQSFFPHHPIFAYFQAVPFHISKRYPQALSYFNKCIELNDNYNDEFEINSLSQFIDNIYCFIGSINNLKNEKFNALEAYTKALIKNKFNSNALNELCKLIRQYNEKEIIHMLNNIYNKDVKEDIIFLIKHLSDSKLGMTMFYYWKIWNQQFKQHDSTYLMALLGAGKYQEVFTQMLEAYENLEKDDKIIEYCGLYLTVSALLGGDANQLAQALEKTPAPYNDIVKYYSGVRANPIDDSIFPAFLAVLEQLIVLTNEETVRVFLSIPLSFSIVNQMKMIELLQNWHFHCLAIELASKALIQNSNFPLLLMLGKGYYFTEQYEKCIEAFTQALTLGGSDNSMLSYVIWIKEKTNQVDHEANTFINTFEKIKSGQ